MTASFPNLTAEVELFKAQQEDYSRLLVAYSGGLDSTVLLHILAQDSIIKPKLIAVHINHQLQSQSDDWSDHCLKFCNFYNIAYRSIKVHVNQTQRQGVEAVARQRRYEALFACLEEGDSLLTAHHQRDQAETFLLNLTRGSGIGGLAGMPYKKAILTQQHRQAYQVRPLINVPYDELVAYAQNQKLSWIEDPTNTDVKFRRNLVRHQILPEFRQAWSNIDAQISRSAKHMQEAQSLLQRLAEQQLHTFGYGRNSIDLNHYQHLDWIEIKNLLRYWSESICGFKMGFSQLQWVQTQVFLKPSVKGSLKLANGELRLYRTKLYYITDLYKDYELSIQELESRLLTKTAQEKKLGNQFTLRISKSLYEQKNSELSVRSIRSTDDINRNSLKKWFQSQGIPPWLRAYWPVLALDDKMLAVWGMNSSYSPGSMQSLLQKQKHADETIAISLDDDMIHAMATNN